MQKLTESTHSGEESELALCRKSHTHNFKPTGPHAEKMT